MGKYINVIKGTRLPVRGKAEAILVLAYGFPIPEPPALVPDLVVVVENGYMDAALYVENQYEYDYVTKNPDSRPKHWLIIPDAHLYAE